MARRRPTRSDLLQVLSRVKRLADAMEGAAGNDRNPNSRAQCGAAWQRIEAIYLEVAAHEPVEALEPTGQGWGDAGEDDAWRRAV